MKKELNREHKIKSTQKMNKWRKILNKKKHRGIGPGSCHDPGLMNLRPLTPAFGHVDSHWSRFISKPGLMTLVISPDALVPVQEPGLMGLMNRDKWTCFY